LAEVIKYGIIEDPELLSYVERNLLAIMKRGIADLEYIVSRCSKIKAGIVSRDEREELGLRTVLNLGHTAGHAIETASGYRLFNHGEAVALGILVACGISRRLGLIADGTERRIESVIKEAGLPIRIKGIGLQKIIDAHYRDKKFLGGKNRFVLIKGVGKTQIVGNISLKIIRDSIKERI
jgi:3-dehydroquinate synthase